MLLRCIQDHQVSQNETQHFEPGKVYSFEGPSEDLGRRLLQDFGKNSQHVARHNEPKFERVAVEGDNVQVVVNGEPQNHAVTADEAYSGPVIQVTPQGVIAPGASGEVDHSHRSQSEPQQPPYAPEGEKLQQLEGDAATEADHTTATEPPSAGVPGDVLSPTAPSNDPGSVGEPRFTSESSVGSAQPSNAPEPVNYGTAENSEYTRPPEATPGEGSSPAPPAV